MVLETYTKKHKWFTQRVKLPVSIHLNRDVKPKIKIEVKEEVVGSILEHTTQHGAIKGKTQETSVKYYNLDAIIFTTKLMKIIR